MQQMPKSEVNIKCALTHHRVFIAICNGGVEIGRVNAFAPDYSKAKVAAAKLFALFDRQSLIDPTDTSGQMPVMDSAIVRAKIAGKSTTSTFFV